jgi:hypothetical protein
LFKLWNFYLESFKKTSWDNLISVVTDLGILFVSSLAYVVYVIMINNASQSLNKIMNGVDVNNTGSFMLNIRIGFQFISSLLVFVLLIILFYSLLNGIFWLRKSGEKISMKLLWKNLKKNVLLALPIIVMLYLFYNIVKEPYWAYLDMLIIALFVLILPITNIVQVEKPKLSSLNVLTKSIHLFFNHFGKFAFHYFIVAITIFILSSIANIFIFLPPTLETIMLSVAGLFILSWIRIYIYDVVKKLLGDLHEN